MAAVQGKVVDQVGILAQRLFEQFLIEFTVYVEPSSTSHNHAQGKEYIEQAAIMTESDLSTMYVDFGHVTQYNSELADIITMHYYQVEPYLSQGVHNFMKQVNEDVDQIEDKRYCISFFNLPVVNGIRDLKTQRIGQLMSLQGTVTRSSQVRPELLVGSFRCQDCSTITKDVEQHFKYTEPQICQNPVCNNRDNWNLMMEESVFVDWQMVRVQENSNEIPAGSMPRACKVILRNEIVEQAKPGDNCVFTGTLIVVPDVGQFSRAGGVKVRRDRRVRTDNSQGVTGLKALGVRDLTFRLCFLACSVRSTYAALGNTNARADTEEELKMTDFTEEQRHRILQMSETPKLYTKIAKSLAPTIFGHDEIKRGVLLMLLGGVHKVTPSGTSIRGDINVCIVGDPSTSKSQFLKYVCEFLPRAVYTSGKASSAAGLTASCVRDPETGEFTIEAGALMLADNGICCIDEFDKMDITDQVAIHEAMEQQTISIAKAGIQATLNARTSILAAANPIKGRYDKSRTLKQNVDISPPIMSRFDLFFVVLDQCEEIIDYHIARHIVNVHSNKEVVHDVEFSAEDLKTYIAFARTLKPKVTEETKKAFVENYVALRANDASGASKASYRITVRQLESMIRLSEARARLDLSNTIQPKHVKEAARLLKQSILHVATHDIDLGEEEEDIDGEDFGENSNGNDGNDSDNDDDDGYTKGSNDRNNNGNAGGQGSKARKITLTFEEYRRIANLIVMHMRECETDEVIGMKQADIINWYLEQQGQDIDSSEELLRMSKTVRFLIQRLVNVDHILLVEKKAKKEANRILYVHPNYNVDDSSTANLDVDDSKQSSSSSKSRKGKSQNKQSNKAKRSRPAMQGNGAGAGAGAGNNVDRMEDDYEESDEEIKRLLEAESSPPRTRSRRALNLSDSDSDADDFFGANQPLSESEPEDDDDVTGLYNPSHARPSMSLSSSSSSSPNLFPPESPSSRKRPSSPVSPSSSPKRARID